MTSFHWNIHPPECDFGWALGQNWFLWIPQEWPESGRNQWGMIKTSALGSVQYPFLGMKTRTRTNLMAFRQFRWYIMDSHNRSDKAWYTLSTHHLHVFAPCLLCYNLSHVCFQAINELFYPFSSWQLWGVVILFPVQRGSIKGSSNTNNIYNICCS